MNELRQEDVASYANYVRMAPDVYDEILQRIAPRLEKQDTFWRKALTPGLKLAVTLRYLATGDSYLTLQYDCRIAKNTIALFIPQVCDAIIEEYMEEAIHCPTTPWKKQEHLKRPGMYHMHWEPWMVRT